MARKIMRKRSSRSHSLGAKMNRHVVRPVKKALSNGMPSWLMYSLIGLGTVGVIYGLMQYRPVSDFLRPVTDPIADLFTSEDEDFISEEIESESRSFAY